MAISFLILIVLISNICFSECDSTFKTDSSISCIYFAQGGSVSDLIQKDFNGNLHGKQLRYSKKGKISSVKYFSHGCPIDTA
jgi:hypothetical protein